MSPKFRLIVSTAAILAVAAGGDPGPGTPTAPAAAATTAVSADGLRPVALTGLSRTRYTVTLLSGDQVTMTRTGGRYTVTTTPAARADGSIPTIEVQIGTNPKGEATSVLAVPSDAQAPIAAGVLDKRVFDVLRLASRAEKDHGKALAVTVRYGSTLTALPGATTVARHADSRTADLTVEPGKASAFWAALRGASRTGDVAAYVFDHVAPKLGGGATAVWPTGLDPATAKAQGDTGQPLHRFTLTVKRTKGDVHECSSTHPFILCPARIPELVQVAGAAIRSGFQAIEGHCVDLNPCTTWELAYAVPPGKYMVDGHAIFWIDGREQELNLAVPEITVTGDAALTLDGDTAKQLTVGTPRPSEVFIGSRETFRTFADGWGGATLMFTGYSNSRFWAVPSTPATIGTFHLGTNWVLGKTMLSMTVTAPKRVQLHAMLPEYQYDAPVRKVVRFDGRHTLALADGGLGRDADLAGIDAKGKLLLLRIDANKVNGGGKCNVGNEELARAKAAGAAGVLIDPISSGGPWPAAGCDQPIEPDWFYSSNPDAQVVPDIPYASTNHAEAESLRALLARGPVKVDVSGYDSVSPYVYALHIYQEGRIPASLHTELTDAQLATQDTTLKGEPGQPADLVYSAFRPNESSVAGVEYLSVPERVRFTTYRGPVSPDLVRVQQYWPTGRDMERTLDVVDRAAPSSVGWSSSPRVPGAPELSSKIFAAQPGKWEGDWSTEYCPFCRHSNTLTPITDLVAGSDPEVLNGPYSFAPANLHLYDAAGTELPQGTSFIWGPTYELAPEARKYRLTGANEAGTTSTAWTFTSSAPTAYTPPQGYRCAEDAATACHADPLIFLRYDLSVEREIKVSAYHLAAGAPAVTSLTVAISTDRGTTWKRLTATGHGGFRIPSNLTGTISVKASASDAGGNTVEQTVLDAGTIPSRH